MANHPLRTLLPGPALRNGGIGTINYHLLCRRLPQCSQIVRKGSRPALQFSGDPKGIVFAGFGPTWVDLSDEEEIGERRAGLRVAADQPRLGDSGAGRAGSRPQSLVQSADCHMNAERCWPGHGVATAAGHLSTGSAIDPLCHGRPLNGLGV